MAGAVAALTRERRSRAREDLRAGNVSADAGNIPAVRREAAPRTDDLADGEGEGERRRLLSSVRRSRPEGGLQPGTYATNPPLRAQVITQETRRELHHDARQPAEGPRPPPCASPPLARADTLPHTPSCANPVTAAEPKRHYGRGRERPGNRRCCVWHSGGGLTTARRCAQAGQERRAVFSFLLSSSSFSPSFPPPHQAPSSFFPSSSLLSLLPSSSSSPLFVSSFSPFTPSFPPPPPAPSSSSSGPQQAPTSRVLHPAKL